MECGRDTTDVLGVIDAAQRRVVVLTGPAGAGKTRAMIELYERYAAETDRPGCLLLAPNVPACRWLRRQLLDRQPTGVLVEPRVMTFASLAGALMAAGKVQAAPLSAVRRRVVLEGIIAEQAAAGALAALGPLANTPGLVGAVDRSIAELKRAAVEPETLAEAVDDDAPAKHRDLLAVYRAYQDYLRAQRLYDEEGRMWLAREALAAMDGVPLEGLSAVAADGFTDFTPTQLDILRLLSDRVERLVITLPYDEDGREKLWHWTGRQLRWITERFGDACHHTHAAARPAGAARGLARTVFLVDPPQVPWPEGVAAIEAGDPQSECRAVARWAKQRISEGVPPEDMAVIGRRREDIDAGLHQVFTEAGIPASPPGMPLAATAAGRMLIAVVAMADRFESPAVLRVLGGSWFDPSRLGPFDATAQDAAQLIIREQNVLSGRDRYGAAAERLAERLVGWTASDEDGAGFATPQQRYLARLGPETVAAGGELMEALLTRVDPLAAGGTLADMAATCRDLMDTLLCPPLIGSAAGGDDELMADGLRAWSAVRGVLDELAAADAPGGSRRLTVGALGDLLTAVLGATLAPSAAAAGSIPIIGALDARAIRARHVWLMGLNESVFPAAATESALIAEGDRQRWAEGRHFDLDRSDDLTAREMLLLYLTITRADEGLTISWRAADAAGRAAAPSSFLDALLAPTDPASRHMTVLPSAEFAPPIERIVSRRELLNAAMAEAAGGNGGDLVAWAAARRENLPVRLARPLWAARRRWAPDAPDGYDGVLSDPAILSDLSRRIPAEVVLSVSQLNTYLGCPWRWFAERALALAELTAPDDMLLPRRRGQLVHAVLRRLLADVTTAGKIPVTSLADPNTLDALDVAIEAEAAPLNHLAECAGLWEAELRRLRRDVAAYLTYQAEAALPDQRVGQLELAFGMGGAEADASPEPLVLDGPAGRVRLRGKIDRVDWVTLDGEIRPFVIDYKTGKLPDLDADAQLPVYIKAVETIYERPAAGGAVQAVGGGKPPARYLAEIGYDRGKLKRDEGYTDRLDGALAHLHRAVAGMAAGRFAVTEVHDCAESWCPFRRICGYSEVRAAVKASEDEGNEHD